MMGSVTRLTRVAGSRVWPKLSPRGVLVGVATAFIGAAFLVSELMHYLLVPDLGRHGERMIAEALSALVVGCLAAALFRISSERHQATLARLQMITLMNHHIRNALAAISLSTYVIPNPQSVRVIQEAVDRIEWTLREILPREEPIPRQRDGF